MSQSYISATLRKKIISEFGGRCAYCHTPTKITGARLVIDHIIPQAKGGQTQAENLCLACNACNEFKGVKVSNTDPLTDDETALFNPRHQIWRNHFRWSNDGTEIIGLTSVGRATVLALNMNHLEIVEARKRWVMVGWHPPEEDL